MDPVIFDVFGPIKLRWYGLGYLLAFVFGFLLLRWLAKKKLWVMGESKVADFITYAA
ncbi:MAG: prolipoprotein diacylglyceryl transferase family protein, partial [Akkermansiaceae bacterium]